MLRARQRELKISMAHTKPLLRVASSSAVSSSAQPNRALDALQATYSAERSKRAYARTWMLRAPRRHRTLARFWLLTQRCKRCGESFSERENLGVYNCSAHPYLPDGRTQLYACCGASASLNVREHVWWKTACTRAHHVAEDAPEWDALDPQTLFELVPASLYEVTAGGSHRTPFLNPARRPRASIPVLTAEDESAGITFESSFMDSVAVLFPKAWPARTKRIGMSMSEAAAAEDVRRAALDTFSYLRAETVAETPATFFEPYFLIPRVDIGQDFKYALEIKTHVSVAASGIALRS